MAAAQHAHLLRAACTPRAHTVEDMREAVVTEPLSLLRLASLAAEAEPEHPAEVRQWSRTEPASDALILHRQRNGHRTIKQGFASSSHEICGNTRTLSLLNQILSSYIYIKIKLFGDSGVVLPTTHLCISIYLCNIDLDRSI